MQTTITTILDTRRQKDDKTYPVKLRVTFTMITNEGKKYVQRYYPTPYSLTKDEWTKVCKPRSDEHREIRRQLNVIEFKAQQVVDQYEVITPELFEVNYMSYGRYRTVNDLYVAVIEKLNTEGRTGSADAYKSSLSSIKAFAGKDEILFGEINVEWLEEYEQWMIDEGRSTSSVGIYLRALRAIFNLAIKKNIIKHDLYPFGSDKYVIPSASAFKRALTVGQKDLLLTYDCKDDADARWALDVWIFSLFCWGINFKDICYLRYSAVTDEAITVVREKTKNTKRIKEPLVIPLSDQAREIIRRHGRKTLNPSEFVFPVLDSSAGARTHHNQKKSALKDINEKLKAIGQALGFQFKLTTYSARHTFATILKDKGVSPRAIQEMLGHQSATTTENYFSTTLTDEKRAVVALLMPTAKQA